MAYNDFMNKVKQWDNRAAQWMGRHFYIILFEIILAIIFVLAFINALKLLNASFTIHNDTANELALIQSVNTTLIVMLLILISLGVLNIINSNSRLRGVLKNIEFNLSKRRVDQKPQDD